MPRLKQAGEGGILPEGMSTSLDGEKGGGGGSPGAAGPNFGKPDPPQGSPCRRRPVDGPRRSHGRSRDSEEARPEPSCRHLRVVGGRVLSEPIEPQGSISFLELCWEPSCRQRRRPHGPARADRHSRAVRSVGGRVSSAPCRRQRGAPSRESGPGPDKAPVGTAALTGPASEQARVRRPGKAPCRRQAPREPRPGPDREPRAAPHGAGSLGAGPPIRRRRGGWSRNTRVGRRAQAVASGCRRSVSPPPAVEFGVLCPAQVAITVHASEVLRSPSPRSRARRAAVNGSAPRQPPNPREGGWGDPDARGGRRPGPGSAGPHPTPSPGNACGSCSRARLGASGPPSPCRQRDRGLDGSRRRTERRARLRSPGRPRVSAPNEPFAGRAPVWQRFLFARPGRPPRARGGDQAAWAQTTGAPAPSPGVKPTVLDGLRRTAIRQSWASCAAAGGGCGW